VKVEGANLSASHNVSACVAGAHSLNAAAGPSKQFSLSMRPSAPASREMRLQSGLGMSLIFTRARREVARTAFQRNLAIADEHRDIHNQMLLLGPLYLFHFRTAGFKTSLQYAKRSVAIAKIVEDPSAMGLAHASRVSLHYMGDLDGARVELEAALKQAPNSERAPTICLGFDCYIGLGYPWQKIYGKRGRDLRPDETLA
jgi:hypothetical protein